MCFSSHYNSIEDSINISESGISKSVSVYGVNSDYNTISFWSDYKLSDTMIEATIHLNKPLVINSLNYDVGDGYFETQCVGYAVEHGYDSVIIENGIDCNYIKFDIPALNMARIEFNRLDERSKAPAKGIKAEVLLKNTGKLSPDRVDRAMKDVRTKPPVITGASELAGTKYFRAEYNFKSSPSKEFRRQWGYADISKDKVYVKELYCTCKDFYYRLYAPFIAAGLATWDLPKRFKTNRNKNIKSTNGKTPINTWTDKTNPEGKLFLCKHLWAFIAYYVTGTKGNSELSDDEIEDTVTKFFGDYSEDDENSMSTEFQKKYGRLYRGKAGSSITQAGTKKRKQSPKKDTTAQEEPTEVVDDTEDTNEEE